MKRDIEDINDKINKLKMSFSWRLFDCDDDESCKRSTIKEFLAQLFGYTKEHDTIRI